MTNSTETKTLEALAALDLQLTGYTKGIKWLAAISWPSQIQTRFLEDWHVGRPCLPHIVYPHHDYSSTRAKIKAIQKKVRQYTEHPVAEYIKRTAESFIILTQLLDALGTNQVCEHSISLFGKPGDSLPGSDLHNIDAAHHFISLANKLYDELADQETTASVSAEQLQTDLQAIINKKFTFHTITVVLDPDLTAKAAAGPTRIRLQSSAHFTEYDRHQLLEHEAFVHSLTALNGREQPHLTSLGLNSPRITATQEGLATFAELITASIDIRRMKRISMRIIAIDMALKGADFMDVFQYFLNNGQPESDSFTSTMRVFRGVPLHGGTAFTKDTVYLHGLLSVHTFFRWALKNKRLRLIRYLFAGKMTLHDVMSLEPYFESGFIVPPLYTPQWISRANGLAGILAFSLFANRIQLDRIGEEDLLL